MTAADRNTTADSGAAARARALLDAAPVATIYRAAEAWELLAALLAERDAAVARADRLTDAIGDPDGILAGCDASASMWAFHRLRRIAAAAAAVSPPPAPTTCPTCGSDDPLFRNKTGGTVLGLSARCPDPWHQAAT